MSHYADLRAAAQIVGGLRPSDADEVLASLTSDDLEAIAKTWQFYARPNQLRPDGCNLIWFRQCGRGEGKTRSAAEERLDRMEDWGAAYQGILINKTLGDARQVNVFGESGLVACARRRGYDLAYHGTDHTVTHPLGGTLQLCTPERPDGPRGFQCNDFHADEVSSWGPQAIATWRNLQYAWRLPTPEGWRKTGTITSTPKPNPITFLLLRSNEYKRLITVTRGSTRDNLANLDPDMLEVLGIYDGTSIGRQETEGELLESSRATIEQDTIHAFRVSSHPALTRIIVSVDPSISDTAESDDAGIVVVGSSPESHAYLLHSQAIPTHRLWPRRAVELFLQYNCDCVVVETNQGGKMMTDAIAVEAQAMSVELGREIVVPVRPVWASTSKQARAEPVGALYERGRIHHVDVHREAERELSSWVPGMPSPNIMDALVQGVSHLLLGDSKEVGPFYG